MGIQVANQIDPDRRLRGPSRLGPQGAFTALGKETAMRDVTNSCPSQVVIAAHRRASDHLNGVSALPLVS